MIEPAERVGKSQGIPAVFFVISDSGHCTRLPDVQGCLNGSGIGGE